MSFRISPVAPPGSLLKGARPREVKAKKEKPAFRNPRVRDEEHLDAIRQCPCLICRTEPGCDAAHIRFAAPGKTEPGMQAKPDDKWTVPLCRKHHDEQHQDEKGFWKKHGIDVLRVAEALHRVSPNLEAMRAICFIANAFKGDDNGA